MTELNATENAPHPPMRLCLASPFYEVKAYSPYITSLLSSIRVLEELKIPWEYFELSGDSYVDRAKNSLVHRFMEETDFTHILIIDSDLAWNVEGFIRIIKAGLLGAEVVGGSYPNKNNWSTFGAIPLLRDGKPAIKEVNGMKLIEMWGIPGGFILYSRKAFERTKSNLNTYIDPNISVTFHEYFKMFIQQSPFVGHNETYVNHLKLNFAKALNDYGEYMGDKKLDAFLECFRCNIEKNGGRIGEDIYFQQRYREMGGTIWCEPNIHFTHFGVKGWEGNYLEYLEAQDNPQPTEVGLSDKLAAVKQELEELGDGKKQEIREIAQKIEEHAEVAGV